MRSSLPLYNLGKRKPSKCQVFQHFPAPMESPSSILSFLDGDDELFIDKNTVFWLGANGTLVRKSYTFPTKPVDAIFTDFFLNYAPNTVEEGDDLKFQRRSVMTCLCVLSTPECLKVYTPGGSVFQSSLPFRAKSLWKLNQGLLIEREKLIEGSYSLPYHPHPTEDLQQHVQYAQQQYQEEEEHQRTTNHHHHQQQQQPVLFTLFHPLDEIKPVSVIPMLTDSNHLSDSFLFHLGDPKFADFFCDSEQVVEFSSTHPNCIVTFNTRTNQYHVYNIQRTRQSFMEARTDTQKTKLFDFQNEEISVVSNDLSFSQEEDEDTDRPIVSEFLLELVWSSEKFTSSSTNSSSSSSNSSSPLPTPISKKRSTVFLASTWEEIPLLCLFHADHALLLLLELTLHEGRIVQVKQLHSKIPCQAIVPIHRYQENGCPWSRDFIVLALDQTLLMYRGDMLICQWHLHKEFKDIPITAIDYGVSDRFTIFSGNQRYRVSARLTPSSPLLSRVLDAFDASLLPELALSLRVDVLFRIYQDESTSHGENSGDREWDCLLYLVSHLLRPHSMTTTSTLSKSSSCCSSNNNHPSSSWDALLTSQYRSDYFRENKSLLKGLKIPSISSSSSSSSSTTSTSTTTPTTPTSTTLSPFMTSKKLFLDHLVDLFMVLHLLYEDYKLTNIENYLLVRLVPLLISLATAMHLQDYVDHYQRDFGCLQLPWYLKEIVGLPTNSTSFQVHFEHYSNEIPDIFQWIMKNMQGVQVPKFPMIKDRRLLLHKNRVICKRSKLITSLYEILFQNEKDKEGGASAESLVLQMVEKGLDKETLQDIPIGVSIPFRQALFSCRSFSPNQWPIAAYSLIERQDLIAMRLAVEQEETGCHSFSDPVYNDILRSNDVTVANAHPIASSTDTDGLQVVQDITRLRFGRDRRVKEVCKLLRSSLPMYLMIDRRPELSDHDYMQEQQAQLLLLCKRSMALPTARGMLTMRTLQPRITEQLQVPELTLSARAAPSNAIISLNVSLFPADLTVWPEFHNGVAAGLRLAAGVAKITRTWIVYNKPQNPDNSHAGVLLALGLQGYLPSLAMTDVYAYLSPVHDVTSVGILIGMAAAKRGSMDRAVLKMLYLHLPSFLPAVFSDIDVSSISQSAALIGIGLLHQGTGHRLMTEQLLVEIGRRPTAERFQDRESYSLSAGLSLGMILLGRGTDGGISGLADLGIEDRLDRYMLGGKRQEGNDSHADHAAKCSRIREGDSINIEVTAPGATLALGLMFLKSNNYAIASRLEIPDTLFLLDYVRPDLLMLRVLSRSLVMWDSVVPTIEWVESQIPSIVQNVYTSLGKLSSSSSNNGQEDDNIGDHVDRRTICQVHANVTAGACLALGMRYAGTANLKAQQVLFHYIHHFRWLRGGGGGGGGGGAGVTSPGTTSTSSSTLDSSNIGSSGAGSTGATASSTGATAGSATFQRPDRSTLEMCLGVTSQAIGLVMAGTGDVSTLRVLREIRRKNDAEITYGNHMAIHMAIGLLFLGGGHQTIARSNEAIAALVVALYPRYPSSTTDNRYHLQALRHLYVLAVQSRCIEAIDVDTKAPCFVPLEVEFSGYDTSSPLVLRRTTPCLLPDLNHNISRIRTSSPRYHLVDLDLVKNPDIQRAIEKGRRIFVKRKIGHLSYLKDPHGVRSLVARAFPKGGVQSQPSMSEFIHSFTEDPNILAFCQYFCTIEPKDIETSSWHHSINTQSLGGGPGDRGGSAAGGAGLASFSTAALYECLTSDKPEMVVVYLMIYHSINHLKCSWNSIQLSNIKLLLLYYEQVVLEKQEQPVLQKEFLSTLQFRLDEFFLEKNDQNNVSEVLKEYTNHGDLSQCKSFKENSMLFSCFLRYMVIPCHRDLQRIKDQTGIMPLVQLQEKGIPLSVLTFLHLLYHPNSIS